MKNTKFKVIGMSCAACSARVERAVSSLLGVDACEVNLLLGEMTVLGDASSDSVISAVEKAGYGAEIYKEITEEDDSEREAKEQTRSILRRLVFSSALLLVLMYISMGYAMWHFPMPAFLTKTPIPLGIAELALTSLIMVINKHFFVNGVRGIVNLAPNMDTLVSLGSFVSYVYSIILLFKISDNTHSVAHALHGLYFESAAMILVLISLGKMLESIAKGKTTSAIRALMDLTPKTAIVIRDGIETEIPARDIKAGDVFIVKKGVNIACDGVVIDGEISLDESALTGESLPKDATPGSFVYGATTVLSGYAKIRAERVGEKTAIAEIVRMVKEASSSKAPVAKTADKIAGVFVPSVLLLSLVTFTLWAIFGSDISDAVTHAVTVLVISCPCALGLATPVAIMVGTGVGARRGILFKNAASLESAGKIKTVAFDKTGTVTEGKPEVCDVVSYGMDKARLMAIAGAIEEKSEHPLAVAVVNFTKGAENENNVLCEKFEASVGGVKGTVNGEEYYIGNERFILECLSLMPTEDFTRLKASGKTALIMAKKDAVLGVIAISDKIKADSTDAVESLKSLGIKTVMITGDNAFAAKEVAERVGIDTVIADVLPNEKANVIKELKKDGIVAMVGDGINDSVALTEANVGIALSQGADVAMDSADVVLTRGSLFGVVSAVKLGRRTLLNVYENLFWAFSYNVIGIPLAAGVFGVLFGWYLTPMFGAAAMSVSSFLVVMNALRLNLYNPDKKHENKNNSLQNCANLNVRTAINTDNTESIEHVNTNDIKDKERNERMNNVVIKIEGMMCPHCSGRVMSLLTASELVKEADVSHERGDAIVTLNCEATAEAVATLENIITEAGYKVI